MPRISSPGDPDDQQKADEVIQELIEGEYISIEEISVVLDGGEAKIPLRHADMPQIESGPRGQGGDGQGHGPKGSAPTGEDPLYGTLDKDVLLKIMKDWKLPVFNPRYETKWRVIGTFPPEMGPLDETKTVEAHILHAVMDDEDPSFVFEEEDLRHRLIKPKRTEIQPTANLFFMRDVSGSVTDKELEASYVLSKLVEFWLKTQYKDKVRTFYIPHHGDAWVETPQNYYKLQPTDGTSYTPAYEIIRRIMSPEKADYKEFCAKGAPSDIWVDPEEEDVYILQMTDGGPFDTAESVNKLEEVFGDKQEPRVSMFGYVEMYMKGGWASAHSDVEGYWKAATSPFNGTPARQRMVMSSLNKYETLDDIGKVMGDIFGVWGKQGK